MNRFNFPIFLIIMTFGLTSFSQDSGKTNESTIVLVTSSGNIYGTLNMPTTKKKAPIALIIAGSGPTDRNGNNNFATNNSLKMLADALAEKNIASIRFDKRGVGQSKDAAKEEIEMRFEDNIADIEGWLDLIKTDGRFGKITIIGHSEGSLIGMLSANKADAYISLAGPGRPADVVLKEQLSSIPQSMQPGAFVVIDSLKMGHTVTNYDKRLFSLFRPSVQPYMISWMKFDPAKEISKVKVPTMIVQGTKDLQVSIEDSKLLFENFKKAKYLLIPNMNHVLKSIISDERKDNFDSYGDAKMPLDKTLAKEIQKFIKKYGS